MPRLGWALELARRWLKPRMPIMVPRIANGAITPITRTHARLTATTVRTGLMAASSSASVRGTAGAGVDADGVAATTVDADSTAGVATMADAQLTAVAAFMADVALTVAEPMRTAEPTVAGLVMAA